MREALLKGKMINFQTGMEYTDIPEDDADWEARAHLFSRYYYLYR